MARIESSITVQKPIEDVFAFLSKRESHLNFIPRMVLLTQTSQGDFTQIGGTANGMLNYFGVKIPVKYQIIENDSTQKLAMMGWMGMIVFKDGYILEKENQSTKINFWLELSPTGWMKVFSPFMGLIGKIHAWETLRNLKREINA